MTKMQLKVTVITFALLQLEKISRLVACPLSTESPLPYSNFSIPLPFLGFLVRSVPSPLKKGEGGEGFKLCNLTRYIVKTTYYTF